MNTKYGRPGCKDEVWKKAKIIKGLDPNEFRECSLSKKIIRYFDHGNNKSEYNWDIDHWIPKASGGPDDLWNLWAVSASKNRSMGSSMVDKPDAVKLMFSAMRAKRGIVETKTDFKWDPSICGKRFWVKASPVTTPKIGIIQSYDSKSVSVFWEDAKYEMTLPLDKHLFESIPEGRPKRRRIS